MASSNVPDPTESFLRGPGEPAYVYIALNPYSNGITYFKDLRRDNSGTISFHKEDHTLGNCLKSVLLRDQRVIFAGYRVPHPLENIMNVQVQTTDETNPIDIVLDAIEDIDDETTALLSSLEHS